MIFLILLLGCNRTGISGDHDIFRPDWSGIDTAKIDFKFGDRIRLNLQDEYIDAVVLDFSQDETGLWIGFCFINDGKLFGRQIPSGLLNRECVDLFDIVYVKQEFLTTETIVDNLHIDINAIRIGAISTMNNYSDLISAFNYGLEQREKEPTPCNKGLASPNSIRERYFEIEMINKN
ncbi:MAG: hypothetical protein IH597_16330 [Bacteroidales bacterium]|nr:hypothetical protein [Bacteroidales bacterium]